MTPAVVILDRPKYEVNVGSVLRSAEIFGVRTVVVVGTRYVRGGRWRAPTDVHNSAKRLDLREVDTVDAALALVPEHAVVVVERRQDGVPLPTFRHPPQAVYVFGPEDGAVACPVRAATVEIPSAPGLKNPHIGSLNLAVAASIVLYARLEQEL